MPSPFSFSPVYFGRGLRYIPVSPARRRRRERRTGMSKTLADTLAGLPGGPADIMDLFAQALCAGAAEAAAEGMADPALSEAVAARMAEIAARRAPEPQPDGH